jgi:hypothetical protein
MQCQELDVPELHRKDDFPDAYTGISTRDLLTVYKAGPTRLGGVLSGLTDEELKQRRPQPPEKDKWSIQEIAMHVADAEIMGAARLRQTLAEPGASFALYDQDAWTSGLGYQSRDRKALENAVWLFSALRTGSTLLLETAKEQDWTKWGNHADWGPLTLRQLLELYADHGERHIEQIVAARAVLGKPLIVPRLLPKRLY